VQEVPEEWYPVFAKPRYEGTAKGIGPWSRCEDPQALAELRDRLVSDYRQDVLVEPWLPGAEYTIALAGVPLKALPMLERAIHKPTGIGIHAVSAHDPKANLHAFTFDHIEPGLEKDLQDWSLAICKEMEVRHFARLDFKCDAHGHPQFLEINPLPTFAADNTFGILAEIEGIRPAEYLAQFLPACIEDAFGTF
jgi:D-alanine-D-alanine ligase